MLSDSIFTIHRYKVSFSCLNQPIYLIPFGDVHRFSPNCDTNKWLEFLAWAKNKKNAYFLGMGDYFDFLSGSERRELNEASLHEATYSNIEDLMNSQVKRFVNEISFMKGRLLGLIEGNHYATYHTGITTTQEMCRLLGCNYLGISSFIKFAMNRGAKGYSLDIWAHHGRGVGRTLGSGLNTVNQMAEIADADIYLMGHNHKKQVGMKTRLCLNGSGGKIGLSHRKIVLACTGSFLRGYVPDAPSYVARAALPPTDMGTVKIELTPKRDKKDGRDDFYVDIHCSL